MSCWLFGTGGIALEYGLAFFAEPQNMVRPNSPEDSETDFVLNFVINKALGALVRQKLILPRTPFQNVCVWRGVLEDAFGSKTAQKCYR